MAKKNLREIRNNLKTALFKGSFIHNPVLTQLIGVCPIAAAATTLKNGFTLFALTLVLLVITEGLTSLLLRKIPRYIRVGLYVLISVLVLSLLSSVFVSFSSQLGIYVYLLAVNALIVIRCEKFACRTNIKNSIIDAFASALGFGAVAISVGAIREFITYGSLFSAADTLPEISASALPFTGLALLGILAALHKAYIIRFHPTEERDTFSLHGIYEKPLLKDPGLGKKKKVRRKSDDESFDIIRPRYSIEDVVTDRTEKEDKDA